MIPKILIYDNSVLQRRNLVDFINELQLPVDIYESGDFEDTLSQMKTRNFDIIITDVIIENMRSIDTIKEIRDLYPYTFIVFVTAHKDYILELLTYCRCYDYITKPVNKERFQDTIKQILKKIEQKDFNLDRTKNEKNLITHYNSETYVIPIENILFIEQQGYLSIIHTHHRIYQCVSTLINMYNSLNDNFYLTHKSFLVNTKNIDYISYNRKSTSDIFFINYDKTALLSVRKKTDFKKFINNL